MLGARIDVLDHLRVRRGQLVELIHAVPNRLSLALHVLLAGKGIDLAPEALTALILQRRFAGGGFAGIGGLSRRRLRRLVAGSRASRLLLGKRRERE